MELKITVTNQETDSCACFGSTYTGIGTIQRRLAWPLRKDDTQIREAFHILKKKKKKKKQIPFPSEACGFSFFTPELLSPNKSQENIP